MTRGQFVAGILGIPVVARVLGAAKPRAVPRQEPVSVASVWENNDSDSQTVTIATSSANTSTVTYLVGDVLVTYTR